MSQAKRAAKSVLIIMMFSLGSKLLGFIREALIAAKFGSGMETDTFLVASTATALVGTLIGTSINTTMIPILSEIEVMEGKQGKKRHTSNILNIVLFISFILIIVGWFLAPAAIRILAVGFKGEQYALAVQLMRIGLPVMFFSGVVFVLRGYLQNELMFTESAASNFPYNFVYIFFLIFLSDKFGIKGLMIASVAAAASQILIQLPGVRKLGYKHEFIFDIKDKYIKKILLLVPPVLLGVAINDLNSIIDRTLASNLVTGSISALNYANRLYEIVLVVFISAITTVVFPMLSQEFSKENLGGMKKIIRYGVNLIMLITIPATVGLIILSTPVVRLAFQRGAFDSTDTIMTAQALIFYSIGLSAMGLNLLITKVYYSLQDTKTPMTYGAISVTLNIVLNLILVTFMAHRGLALATSIATTIATLMMFYGLKKKIGAFGFIEYIKCGVKAGIASLIMGITVYGIYNEMRKALGSNTMDILLSLLVPVSVGVVIYVVLCYLFGVEEIRMAADKVKQRLFTRKK